jgi:ElaB/YqjD/DUF883 family membrane-anchored ribosome-binding protein
MRQQLDTTRLKQELRNVVEEVEHILAEMPETNVGPVAEFKARASRRLHDARTRLDDLEIRSVERVREAGQQAKGYVQQHPWAVIGGASAVAFVLGMLSRTRH